MPALSDRVVSLLRTFVPVVWGSLIAWVLTVIPVLKPFSGFLTAQTSVVVVLTISAWYAGFRWLEGRLPSWVTRVALGSTQTPTYVPITPAIPATTHRA